MKKEIKEAKKEITATKESIVSSILASKVLNKSQKIIELYKTDLEIKEIANLMNIRYNFAYNVISNYCIKNDLEINTNRNNEDSKKSKIIELHLQKKSKIEISKELKTNYNYVFNVIKNFEASLKK